MNTKSLWILEQLSVRGDGHAIGCIGATGCKGWLFVWPRQTAGVRSAEEQADVLESLRVNECDPGPHEIPKGLARGKLERYLKHKHGFTPTGETIPGK